MVELLRANGVGFDYAGTPRAVDGIDLTLHVGEVVALIGPNGSGKSTLLRCLAGLLPLDRGEVSVDGRALSQLKPRERARRAAIVPQMIPRLADVRVFDFCLGGRYAHLRGLRGPGPEDADIVRGALEECDAGEWAERAMGELSGGQRQRVVMARAVAQGARVLLIDEPTTSLDPAHQVSVLELVARRVEQGAGALVVTHDLNLASQFASRALLVDRGRVCAEGPTEDVLVREVLEPVYGTALYYSAFAHDAGAASGRPIVLPWSRTGRGTSAR